MGREVARMQFKPGAFKSVHLADDGTLSIHATEDQCRGLKHTAETWIDIFEIDSPNDSE